jgi:Major tropism determinant N-terminal domain
MSEQLQLRRGTATQVASFTGAQGETIVDTTNNRLVVQDGSTAGGWPAAKLSEVITNTRTPVSDANYTALTSDRLVAYTALTAARVVTLPAASAYPTGSRLLVVDESGACSATDTITISRGGTDTINGASSATLSSPYAYAALESNGSNAWTIVDNSTLGMAQQAASAVAITGGTINGTTVGQTTPAAVSATTLSLARHAVADANYTVAAGISIVAYTAITAARTVTLPAASAFAGGQQLTIIDESGSCSATKTIALNRAGSDTIDGGTSFTLNAAYAALVLESNGSNAWTIVAPGPNVIATSVGIGTAPDPNNPLSVYGPSALFNGTTGMNVTVNKNGSTNTASFIFEDAFSGRAQIGLNGSDNFSFKVSPNGSSWTTAIALDATTGAATLANLRTAVSDAAYSALVTDRLIAYTAITAARIVTLPASSAFPAGLVLTIADESGACSPTDTISVASAGSDTINGATSFVLQSAYAYVALESNGTGKWTVVDYVLSPAVAHTWTAAQTHDANIILANNEALQGTTTSGTVLSMVILRSDNALIIGNSSLTGPVYLQPGSGSEFAFLNAAGSAYIANFYDSTAICFGSNVTDTSWTFYNAVATTGDSAISIRDGAARGSRIRMGNPAGTYDVGLMHVSAGKLTINDGSITTTNYRDLVLRSVTCASNTYANLPSSPSKGEIAEVSDSTTNTWGATISGGGSYEVLAHYNGTNWTVAGV